MKTNLAHTLNKLISYARDNLMLDALDEIYTLNRLAALCGVPAVKPEETETDQTLDALLAELKAAADVDVEAVKDILLPSPHTVDFYFRDELGRKPQKAFDFLFDLYESCGSVAAGEASGKDGYIHYSRGESGALARPVMLDVGTAVPYTPIASGNRIAALGGDDTLFTADITARLVAYATTYGGTIAKRLNDEDYYLVCTDSAIAHAAVKQKIKDGTVKVDILDYPAPALKFSGIGKNAVIREATTYIKAATDAGKPCVAACACIDNAPAVYVIFAKAVEATDLILSTDALACCGVVAAPDFSALLSVLEKGTALSSDLFAFKPLYAEIGGVKLGAKAKATLDEAVAKHIKAAISAASSATEAEAVALLNEPQA